LFSAMILFVCILAFLVAASHESRKSTFQPQPIIYREYFTPTIFQRYYPVEPYIEKSLQQRKRNAGILVKNWRKSIIGLIRLADKNLKLAKEHTELGEFKAAVEIAYTSVENIARALIHCCGGKPDLCMGQEETLRMLSCRFEGNERIEFEKAIENVAFLEYSKRNRHAQHPSRSTTKRILEYASKTVGLFKEIITEYFTTEIPELSEACPKCHSLYYSVLSFTRDVVRYQCKVCNHKWTNPRI